MIAGRVGSVCALLACLQAPLQAQDCDPLPADRSAVQAVARGIIDADNSKDLEAVLSHYAPDAVLHPPDEPPVRGRADIRPRYVRLFESYDPAIVSEVHSVRICRSLAVVSGRNGGVLRGRGGNPDRELADQFVMILEKLEGAWKIVRLIWHGDRS